MAATNQLDVEFISDFDDVVKKKEMDKLNELASLATKSEEAKKRSTRALTIQNMSIKEVLAKTVQTAIDILQDVTERKKPVMEILVGDDRALYVGIILVILSLAIWIISM